MHISESTKRVKRRGQYVSIPDKDCQGWPDLTLWHEKAQLMIFRELKTKEGRLTDAQADRLRSLSAAGQDAKVWRPADWEEIRTTLNGARNPQ